MCDQYSRPQQGQFVELKRAAKPNRAVAISAYLLVVSALAFPRAYSDYKLAILGTLLATLLFDLLARAGQVKTFTPLTFFTIYACSNLLMLVVGVANGNPDQAIWDGMRLGVIFPLLIGLLWTCLASYRFHAFMDNAVLLGAAIISGLIYVALFEEFFGLSLLSETFKQENLLTVGLHEGYFQVVAHSVGSLFFIAGYLIYSLASSTRRRPLFVLAFGMVLVAAMISGRRALQLALAISPLLVSFTGYLFGELKSTTRPFVRMYFGAALLVAGLTTVAFATETLDFAQFIQRLTEVFEDDEGARTSQASALFEGFLNSPIVGSGIGGSVDVVRSDMSPWVYELTYMQFLFNGGLVCAALISLLFAYQFWGIRRGDTTRVSAQVKAGICGVLFLMFGAATNPYLGSFDFLLMLGFIPLARAAAKISL